MAMQRRRFLTWMGALGSGVMVAPAFAQQLQHAPHDARPSDGRPRRPSGRIDLVISGQRATALKSGPDILQTAKSTDFVEKGRHEVTFKGGAVEYVPATFPQHAIAVSIIQGLLVYRFTINGTPPAEWRFLGAGVFYSYVDFVEGP